MNKKVYTIIGVITLLVITLGATYAYFNVVGNSTGGTGTVSAKSDEVGNVSLSGDGGSLHINLTPSDVSNVAGGVFYGTVSDNGYSSIEEKLDVAKIEATSLPENIKYTCTFDVKVKPTEGNLTNITSGEILFSTSTINIDGITTDKLTFSTLNEEKTYHASTTLYSGDINYLRVSAKITSSDSDGGESWLNNINGSFSVSSDNLKCTAIKETAIVEESDYTIRGKMVDENGNALTGYAVLMSTPKIVELGSDGTFEFKNVEPGTHNLYYMGSVNPESLSVNEVKSQSKSNVTFRTSLVKNIESIKMDNRSKVINLSVKDSVEVNINISNGTSDKSNINIIYGSNVSFVITPFDGYILELESDSCNGSLNSETGEYTIQNVIEDKMCNIVLKKYCVYDPGKVWNFEYAETIKEFVTPCNGVYKLEVWGAQGGDSYYHTGGHGGYSYGNINILKGNTLYIYSGGKGRTVTSTDSVLGGFNGGGAARMGASDQHSAGVVGDYVGTGGGASDIRINSTSLYARVIVAGGGGGAGTGNYTSSYSFKGSSYGYGGGTYAGGQTHYNVVSGASKGANQSSSGNSDYSNGGTGNYGSFGVGGDGINGTYAFSGGGGGWYGGNASNYGGYAGGGSGYVYTSSTASYYPSGCLLNSSYYLSNAQTVAGNTSFTSPSGGTETGHTGNGYARITLVSINQM